MYNEYRVVVGIPSGRKAYLEILIPYLLREGDVIDEINLWLNTKNNDDIAYIRQLAANHPDKIKVLETGHATGGGNGVGQFYRFCTDPNTIYLKVDDDICFIERGTIRDLVEFRVENPEPFLVYPNIINNVMMSHLHQRLGCIPMNVGICGWNDFDPVGWKSGEAAAKIHQAFIDHYRSGTLDMYRFPKWYMWDYYRTSIGFICWFGKDLQPFGGDVGGDDEMFLSSNKPRELKRPCQWSGRKIVAHFAYFTQRPYLEASTKLQAEYKTIMEEEIAAPEPFPDETPVFDPKAIAVYRGMTKMLSDFKAVGTQLSKDITRLEKLQP